MPKDKELEIEGARTLDVIKVLKYADQVTPKSESTLYFTLRISNLSNDSIELLRIKENCPQGSVLTGASVDIGSFDSLRKKWNIQELEPKVAASMIYGCELKDELSGRTVNFTTPVIDSEEEIRIINSSQSQKTFSVIPLLSNLVTSLNVTKEFALEGETLSYEVEITNDGPDYSKNVQVTFLCPSSSTYISSVAPINSSYDSSTGLWVVDTIDNDSTYSLLVNCNVDSGASVLTSSIDRPESNSVDLSNINDSLTSSTTITSQCATDLTGITSYNYIGDGLTTASAFEIRNPEQLLDFAENGTSDLDKKFILCSNIDFSSLSEFTSIGSSSSSSFEGSINGNGFSFENYNFDVPLIAFAKGASISNLTINSSSLTCASSSCAFLVGTAEGVSETTVISDINISASSSFSSAYRFSGAIVGYVNGTTVDITNVTNEAPITITSYTNRADGAAYISSIIGYANGAGLNLTSVTNNANIMSDTGYFGGIIGVANLSLPSSFETVVNNGDLVSTNTVSALNYLGGIGGRLKVNNGTGLVSFDGLVNNGNITTGGSTTFSYVGGLFGALGALNTADYIQISNSTVGSITIDNQSSGTQNYTGGMIGYFGIDSSNIDISSISNSSSSATVIGGNYTGGFVGVMNRALSIVSSSASGSVTGKNYTGGFAGAIDFNSNVTNSDYTGVSVSGDSVVGGFAGRISYDSSSNTSGFVSNAEVTGPLNLSFTGNGGGFAGYLYNSGRITDSSVTLSSFNNSSSSSYLGGFVGYIYGYNLTGAHAIIDNSHVYGSSISMAQEAERYVGGFIGRQSHGGASVSSSSTNLSVLGQREVGGFVGYVEGNTNDSSNLSSYTNNTSFGNIHCSNSLCGGFVGYLSSLARINLCTVSNSTGALTASGTGDINLGGFVGIIREDAKITNSSTDLSLDTISNYTGGFAGYLTGEADIVDSFAQQNTIIGNSWMGGFVARVICSSSDVDSDDQCEIKRNYSIVDTIAHHSPTDPTAYSSGGFISYVKTNNQDSQIIIEDNFTKTSNLYSNQFGGGFIAYLSLDGNTPSSADAINIRRNFVAEGVMSSSSAVNPDNWGGFIGAIEGGGSSSQGSITIEDNYTKMTSLDTSLFNSGNYYQGLGGFLGYHESFAPVIVQRNYTTVPILSGNESYRYSGGFIGIIDEPLTGYTVSTYQDNFTVTTNIAQASSDADYFIGFLQGAVAPNNSGNFYSSSSTCLKGDELTPCDATNGATGVSLASFQDDDTNAPLTNWDFLNIWEARSGDYPALRCPSSSSVSFCNEWNTYR